MNRFLIRWVLPVCLIAVATHLAVVVAAPRFVMRRVLSTLAQRTPANTPYHPPQPVAGQRNVPLPSPDLLYSLCTLDLRGGPVAVSVTPGALYMSLAVFDAATDNVFVSNDQQAAGQPISLLIAGPGSAARPAAGQQLVRLASPTGLLLLRGLAATTAEQAQTDAARHTLACREAPANEH